MRQFDNWLIRQLGNYAVHIKRFNRKEPPRKNAERRKVYDNGGALLQIIIASWNISAAKKIYQASLLLKTTLEQSNLLSL